MPVVDYNYLLLTYISLIIQTRYTRNHGIRLQRQKSRKIDPIGSDDSPARFEHSMGTRQFLKDGAPIIDYHSDLGIAPNTRDQT
jgi:hypothetical protein